MIKIVSGWSEKGGSTTAFINLTNALNGKNHETIFYGPHQWHLDKCKSGLLTSNFKVDKSDKLIIHFLKLPSRPNADRVILSCHEKNLFPLNEIKPFWDKVIFINETQRQYHSGYIGDYSIIPNLKENLIKKEKDPKTKEIAAIIGSIDENKQTHVSIDRALNDGYKKIILYGTISDRNYFDSFVKPLISENIILGGYENDKQKIYDSVDAVYLSSLSEVAPLVRDECKTTGTKFFGNDVMNTDIIDIPNEDILKMWINILN